MCNVRVSLCRNTFAHSLHGKTVAPCVIRICLFRLERLMNDLRQTLHESLSEDRPLQTCDDFKSMFLNTFRQLAH